MRRDQSYGIIPLKEIDHEWHVLLVQLHKGHWGLPKGHGETGESPKQSAERELTEETALQVKHYLSQDSLEEHYMFKQDGVLIDKTVTYFLAEVTGEYKVQELEIAAARWVPLKEAPNVATFKETKRILEEVFNILLYDDSSA
jgi:bis(5'-nucleosidyl)-tetraphosphatase